MNKYYYIINLFDSIDRLFLNTYSTPAYFLAIISFVIFFISIIINVAIGKKTRNTACFYISMSAFFAFTSTALICFISVPLNIYLAHLAVILPDGRKLNKKSVIIITTASAVFSIVFSVCTVSGVIL